MSNYNRFVPYWWIVLALFAAVKDRWDLAMFLIIGACAVTLIQIRDAAQPYIQATDAPQGAEKSDKHSGVSA